MANRIVLEMFQYQGLDELGADAKILILDTRYLTTTNMLFGHCQPRITIAENDNEEHMAILDALDEHKLRERGVTLPSSPCNIFKLLEERVEEATASNWQGNNYDFVWLDLTNSIIDQYETIIGKAVTALNVKCLALTLSLRGSDGRTHSARVKRIASVVRKALPYKITDWGYQIDPTMEGFTQPMQLIVFGRIPTGFCRMRISNRHAPRPLPNSDPLRRTHAHITWYGLPRCEDRTTEKGTVAEWLSKSKSWVDVPR